MSAKPNLTIVWFRHGEKAHRNAKGAEGSKQFDPDITSKAVGDVRKKTNDLIKYFGFPTYCISSPFLRARKTAEIMVGEIDAKTRPEIQIDSHISEYLGHQGKVVNEIKNMDKEVEAVTLKFVSPNINETMNELKQRCLQHLEKLGIDHFKDIKRDPFTIWVVCHGIVVTHILETILLNGKKWGYEIVDRTQNKTNFDFCEGLVFHFYKENKTILLSTV